MTARCARLWPCPRLSRSFTPGPAAAGAFIQRRTEAAQVREHPPEQGFGQGGVAFLVGVGEAVLARRRGPAQDRERPRVQAQAVTDIVETDGVDQLRVEQRHDVTSGPGEFLGARIAGQLGDEMGRNEMFTAYGTGVKPIRPPGAAVPRRRVRPTAASPAYGLTRRHLLVAIRP